MSLIALAIAVSTPRPLYAADGIEISVGALFARADLNVKYRKGSGNDGAIGEDDLRSTQTRPWARLAIPLGKRFEIGGEYFSLSSKSTGKAKQSVSLGPLHSWLVSDTEDSYSADFYKVWGGWSPWRDDKTAAWLRFGVMAVNAKAHASSPPGFFDDISEKILAPGPMVGVRLTHKGWHDMRWSLCYDFVYSPIKAWPGQMHMLEAMVEYPLTDRLSVGAGAKWHILHISNQSGNDDLKIRHQQLSPLLFITARF